MNLICLTSKMSAWQIHISSLAQWKVLPSAHKAARGELDGHFRDYNWLLLFTRSHHPSSRKRAACLEKSLGNVITLSLQSL